MRNERGGNESYLLRHVSTRILPNKEKMLQSHKLKGLDSGYCHARLIRMERKTQVVKALEQFQVKKRQVK